MTGPDRDVWSVRVHRPDALGSGRPRITEAACEARTREAALVRIRLLVEGGEIPADLGPRVPGVLTELASPVELRQAGDRITPDFWLVNSKAGSQRLAGALTDPDRQRPVLVLSVPKDSTDPMRPLLDPESLARAVFGLATVVVPPARYTWKPWDVFRRGTRFPSKASPPRTAGGDASGAVLAAERLTLRRNGRILLDNVCLSLAPGSRLAVMGRSGAGKTTLARALAGLVRPSNGAVRERLHGGDSMAQPAASEPRCPAHVPGSDGVVRSPPDGVRFHGSRGRSLPSRGVRTPLQTDGARGAGAPRSSRPRIVDRAGSREVNVSGRPCCGRCCASRKY